MVLIRVRIRQKKYGYTDRLLAYRDAEPHEVKQLKLKFLQLSYTYLLLILIVLLVDLIILSAIIKLVASGDPFCFNQKAVGLKCNQIRCFRLQIRPVIRLNMGIIAKLPGTGRESDEGGVRAGDVGREPVQVYLKPNPVQMFSKKM